MDRRKYSNENGAGTNCSCRFCVCMCYNEHSKNNRREQIWRFTEHYDHTIIERGAQRVDMAYLKRELQP